jgi:osmotically inducible protein OsmC
VTFEQQGEGWAITGIELTTVGKVPGMDEEAFRQAAEAAKENCPVSVALSVPITLNASLG